MLFALAVAVMLSPQSSIRKDVAADLTDPLTGESNALLVQKSDRLDPTKLSPKAFAGKHWEFDWLTSGYGKPAVEGDMQLRFRIYSQERKPSKDVAFSVAMMDLRMWQILYHKYKIDHADMGSGLRLVDEYLCWGGTAGGEQTLGDEMEAGHNRRVNTIYIYDIASFKNPIEMAREVAHEYGHAVLPAIGGFRTPEDWANGYLGEKLFLRWLRDAGETGRIDSSAIMGAKLLDLDAWVKKNVDPLVVDASSHAPNKALLGATGQKAMNSYMGLVLYADSVLPNNVVARAFKLNGSTSARDFPDAIVDATTGASYTVNVPNLLYGKKLWLPVGKSKVKGGKVLARSGSWAQVQPTVGSLVILAPES